MVANILDAGCGIGKTTAMINKINEDNKNKYLYITPLLTEVKRIKESCPNKNFKYPEAKSTKLMDIVKLFEKGENIVSTHALFKKFNEQILDIAKFNNYILIMDEVADVMSELEISKNDINTIIKEYVEIDEFNNLKWWAEEYEGKFEEYKNIIDMGGVIAHSSVKGDIISLVWFYPIKIFESFKEVYVLTYMFEGQTQKSYYEYYNVKFKYLYVKDFKITTEPQIYDYTETKSLIKVCQSQKLNKIGNDNNALSVSWFERNKDGSLIKELKKDMVNFFRSTAKTPSKENLWTTFKEYENILKGKGCMSGFAPINMRATNDYKHTTAVAYMANRYLKPTMKHFFEGYGIEVNEDVFALSELIQFVFRSSIRDKKPIDVFIPSKRMRTLFINWLNKKDE